MLACLLALSLLATPLQAQQAAAKVQSAVGEVSAQSADGKLRRLKKGDRIYPGDTIKTGERGSAQLIYRDRSRMAVRVNTEFKIDKYQYDDKNKKGAVSFFSLLRGALRSVSGLIGSFDPQNVTIDTPLATIGIRGTDHEVVHIAPASGGANPIAGVGTYNKVYKGGTIMKTVRGNLKLDLHQVGYVGGAQGKAIKPVRLKRLPAAIKRQLINKIPMQAKTLPQRDEKAPAGGEQSKKSSRKSNATTGKSGGATERAVPGAARKGDSSLQSVVPNVSKVPASAGPVPIPYPNTGKSTPAKGAEGAARKELRQPLKKIPQTFKSDSSVPEGALIPKTPVPITVPLAPRISIPSSKALKPAIPVTVVPKAMSPKNTLAPKTKTPIAVKPRVSIPNTAAPKAKISPKVAPRVAAPVKLKATKKSLNSPSLAGFLLTS